MKPLLLATLLIITQTSLLKAQSVAPSIGAKASGIGYTASTVSDVWGVYNNIAGIGTVENTTAAFTYDLHPSLPGANRTAAVLVLPLNTGATGIGMYRFGDNLYNEQILTAGYSNQFGIAALGVKANYIQYQTEGFGTKGVFTLSFGGIAKITKEISIGAYITNLNQPSLNDNEKVPTRLNAGFSFTPSDRFFITTEIEKDLDYDATLKVGMQYTFHKKLFARTGYNLHPNTAFFGLGFKTKKFMLDYALQHNTSVGLSHQASVSYQFIRK